MKINKYFANKAHRTIVFIWLGWAIALLGFQAFVTARLDIARPDYALFWTPNETTIGSQAGRIFLKEPFMNRHVSWDSEFYLAIAVDGYESDNVRRANAFFDEGQGAGFWPFYIPPNVGSTNGLSLSYAFLPLYPLSIRALSLPLALIGMSPIATATLAGVIVSLLGTLAAMLAIYELGREELGEEGGIRTAFYLIIFPSAFFLAQVYTEGLFIGLAFWSLVFIQRKQFLWAALLAILATFTRSVGVLLVVPLFLAWLRTEEWRDLDLEWRQIYFRGLPWRTLWHAIVVISPLIAYQLWRISYFGLAFTKVEETFFSRKLLSLGASFVGWSQGFQALFGDGTQSAAYYAIEWGAIFLGVLACILTWRKYRDLAIFSFLVIIISFTSGVAQGMHRYVLAAPSLFLLLGRWGNNRAFDRVWTIVSLLLMGMMATLFSFDMWAG
jgi:hypothetical protein